MAGKVKTRLAAAIGDEKATAIYRELVNHTIRVASKVNAEKIIFLSEDTGKNFAEVKGFNTSLQKGNDLGERMRNAFDELFQEGYEQAVLIGSDCPAISPPILEKAFEELDQSDIVIGPAEDGGYYLIGMKRLYAELFENMKWSNQDVFSTTQARCEQFKLTVVLLPILPDVDEERDLVHWQKNRL